jgi:glycosyltransferase involved in cell wall biosynthesis
MMLVQEQVDARSEAGTPPAEDLPHAPGPTLTIVIPTLNEERNIGWVLERLPAIAAEVILVDGRSTDRTVELARAVRPDIKVVLETRPGKGAALRAGFAAATGDYIVMLDADRSMDPSEIERFVEALSAGCEFVKGSRFVRGGGTADISTIRRLGNGALRGAVNVLYRTNMSDLCYGFIAFRRDKLPILRLRSVGFEIETEMTVRAVTTNLRIGEVASFESRRRYGQSNLHAWRDGRRALHTLLRERLILPETPWLQSEARDVDVDVDVDVARSWGPARNKLGHRRIGRSGQRGEEPHGK